jgi:hypothetical protein
MNLDDNNGRSIINYKLAPSHRFEVVNSSYTQRCVWADIMIQLISLHVAIKMHAPI